MFIYNKLVEVLPIVMDILTISSFVVLLIYKFLSYISSVGDGITVSFYLKNITIHFEKKEIVI